MNYQPRPVSAKELRLKHRIDEIHTELPYYGSRKIAEQLGREGHDTCRETVCQYITEIGLQVLYPHPNLSRRHPDHKVYPYLLSVVHQNIVKIAHIENGTELAGPLWEFA